MSIGVLMLHGFSGGPYEVKPLAEYIQKQYGLDCGNTYIMRPW